MIIHNPLRDRLTYLQKLSLCKRTENVPLFPTHESALQAQDKLKKHCPYVEIHHDGKHMLSTKQLLYSSFRREKGYLQIYFSASGYNNLMKVMLKLYCPLLHVHLCVYVIKLVLVSSVCL